eukprot:NODE_4567_length_570_cov_21.428023_g3322_i0.p4 GENE.NODE_4567_length_570_cov_21.428023_g3322_i0~~NODE_4567_length_570_cov_21.428023_g3322_i0.p4  ORF type:complete len:51 (-),score=10.56 NODE_4567_length_570_cov_21.428023_g3322_i0:4-156(-)
MIKTIFLKKKNCTKFFRKHIVLRFGLRGLDFRVGHTQKKKDSGEIPRSQL